MKIGNLRQSMVARQEMTLVWRAVRAVYALAGTSTAELVRKAGMPCH